MQVVLSGLPEGPAAEQETEKCPPAWRVRRDLVSRLISPITHTVSLIIPIIDLLTKSPDPPSVGLRTSFCRGYLGLRIYGTIVLYFETPLLISILGVGDVMIVVDLELLE